MLKMMALGFAVALLMDTCGDTTASDPPIDPPPPQPTRCGTGDCRQSMREFVRHIAGYARATHPSFILVPQNGSDLVTRRGKTTGKPSVAYLDAIQGLGREDLNFGYTGRNQATPEDARQQMIPFLDIASGRGIVPLVIDYVASGSHHIQESYEKNAELGYVGFAATRLQLDNIPDEPDHAAYYPYQANANAVTSLADVKNFLYLINPHLYGTAEEFVSALEATQYDLLIVDAYFNDGQPLSPAHVARLKLKPGGQPRLVLAYMSIGEAEAYRPYWQPGWQVGNPSFIAALNPDWPDNYKVKYWDPAWQAIIYGNGGSYTQVLLNAGFDGAYLDIIDAYEYFESLPLPH